MNAHEGGRKEVSIVTVEEGAVHVCVSGREQGEEESPETLIPKPSFYCDELLINTHCWLIILGDN